MFLSLSRKQQALKIWDEGFAIENTRTSIEDIGVFSQKTQRDITSRSTKRTTIPPYF